MSVSVTDVDLPPPTADELHGIALYGDNFSPDQIATWFRDEVRGFFELKSTLYKTADDNGYEYLANDTYHFFRRIRGRTFNLCLALGCADGGDVGVLASQVDTFIAIEPARNWWTDTIGGKPAEFRMPAIDGTIDLADNSVDLITVFSVLHHIPNVSAIFAELVRVLRPGGVILLREPVISMGDFTRQRVGLTAHERGISLAFLNAMFARSGLQVEYHSLARISVFFLMLHKAGVNANTRWAVALDAVASNMLRFNLHYWRPGFWKKIGPSWGVFVLTKADKSALPRA